MKSLLNCGVALWVLLSMPTLLVAQSEPPSEPLDACSGIRQILEQPDLDSRIRPALEDFSLYVCQSSPGSNEHSHTGRTFRVPSEVVGVAAYTSWVNPQGKPDTGYLAESVMGANIVVDRTDGGPRTFAEARNFPGILKAGTGHTTYDADGAYIFTYVSFGLLYPEDRLAQPQFGAAGFRYEVWNRFAVAEPNGTVRALDQWGVNYPLTGDYNVSIADNGLPFSDPGFYLYDLAGGYVSQHYSLGAGGAFGAFRLERDGPLKLDISPQTLTTKPSVQQPVSPCGGPPASPQKKPLTFSCIRTDTGAVVPFCDVELKWSARSGSGGHEHNTNRPPGELSFGSAVGGSVGPQGSLQINTGSIGYTTIMYTAPEASGDIEGTGTATAEVDGQRVSSSPTMFNIEVTEADLTRASGVGLQIETASTMHDNHDGYATQTTIEGLQTLAAEFSNTLVEQGTPANQVPPIRVTELSLPRGGLMDFEVEWAPPHCGHRRGDQADVGMRTFLKKHRTALEFALIKAPFTTPVPAESPANPAANHWHLKRK